MNNMANMANMGAMGGPVGVPVPMMGNNGALQHQAGPRKVQVQATDQHRSLLHTHIYDYFLRTGMYDCARSLLQNDPGISLSKDGHGRDENGNPINGLGDDPMDTDSKDNLDQKRPDDLPVPNIPGGLAGTAFLYEWFCLFWDMFNSSKGQHTIPQINQYVSHTQQQSRARMGEQQQMLRNIRPEAYQQQQQFAHQMMRQMPNGAMMSMKQGNPLQRAAVANAQNPQAMQMLQQQKREQPGLDGARPASPGSTDNAPSPSKRPRLGEGAPFNPGQGVVMANGRPAQGMPGQQQAFVTNPGLQAKNNIAAYSANLQQHHGNQMPNKPNMANAGGPQPQGSPMVQQGPDGATISQFYNPGDLAPGTAMRPGPNAQATGSNHALQDYQMQLMLLEQQNKKRLMMARQEQDIGGPAGMQRPDGPGGPPGGPGVPNGPGGQNFQGTSPPGGRNGASPNPTDQMKRASQQMGAAASMGSPLPDGPPSRSSPNAMNFMGGQMDPNGNPHFGMNMNMPGQMNGGMRPPGSHPGQFNGQISQQMVAAQQRQAQQQGGPGGPGMQWPQNGPNGQMAGQGPQPPQGTPQQRSMPPPSAPAAAAVAAGSRNTTSSPQTSTAAPPTPQQGNKAAPKKKDTKNAKSKAAAQKKTAGVTTGATPAADVDGPPEPQTPATPITPVNPAGTFSKPGVNPGQVIANGQPTAAAPPPPVAPVQPASLGDQNRSGGYMDTSGSIDFSAMDFADPMSSNNVLTDFDFDSFLHDGNGGEDGFNFDAQFSMESEIGATE
ncbi:hypothetical protein OQA88_1189 [Cercophora sp. LCS_1]